MSQIENHEYLSFLWTENKREEQTENECNREQRISNLFKLWKSYIKDENMSERPGDIIHTILCIADFHIGHRYGLWPRNFKTDEGQLLEQNECQKRLYRYWRSLIKTAKKYGTKEIWIVGDVFGGLNPKEKGRWMLTVNLDEQNRAATMLLSELLSTINKSKTYVWSGTKYHESLDFRMHMRLVESLHAEGFKSVFFKGSWSFMPLGGNQNSLAFVTHPSTKALIYPQTALVSDARWFKLRYAEGKLPQVKVVIRADRHHYEHIDAKPIHMFQLPCFQAYFPYQAALRSFPMFQPDYGGLFLMLRRDGRLRYQEWLYPPFLVTESGFIIEVPYNKKSYVEDW